jgi:hypothetical protein
MKDRRERRNKVVNKKMVQRIGEDIKLIFVSIYNYYIYISSFLHNCNIEVGYVWGNFNYSSGNKIRFYV